MATGTAPPMRGPEEMADKGLIAHLENTRGAGDHARTEAERWRGLACMADDLPLDPAVKADIEAAAKIYESAAGVGDAIWPEARRNHAMDYGRAEEPRGGRTVEVKADVEKGVQDGHFS